MMLLVRKSESWTISKLRFKSFVSIQSGPKICQCIFYDTPGQAPADKFMKMFISKTHPNAKSLFNRCIKDLNVNGAVWDTCQPLAKRIYIGVKL
jgi:hypothetical protein